MFTIFALQHTHLRLGRIIHDATISLANPLSQRDFEDVFFKILPK